MHSFILSLDFSHWVFLERGFNEAPFRWVDPKEFSFCFIVVSSLSPFVEIVFSLDSYVIFFFFYFYTILTL